MRAGCRGRREGGGEEVEGGGDWMGGWGGVGLHNLTASTV